jgi:MFS family permease
MKRHSRQIFYGWVVLACVTVVLLVTYGVQYSFGVFFTTMLQDLGWSRASLAGAFWMLAGVMILSLFTIPSVYVHLPQYARDLQVQVPRSVFLMLVGLSALIGKLTLGWLSDLLGRRQALLLSLMVGTLALGGLTVARGATALYMASAGFGLYYGTYASLFLAVMADFFGRLHAGALTGLSFALGSVTSAIGPFAMGWVADRTGHYTLAFLCSTFVNSLGIILLALARPPAGRSRSAEA